MRSSEAGQRGNKMPTTDVFLDRAVLGLIKRTGARAVCDYGCGDGSLLKRIDQNTSHRLRLTGIDFFSSWKEEDRPKGAGNLRFIDRAAREYQRLAGRGRAFDLIVSTYALHHFREPLAELAALRKLLKPNGTLFVTDLEFSTENDARITTNLFSYLSEEYQAFRGRYHRHPYTAEEARSLFAAAGFDAVRVRSVAVGYPESERAQDTGHALHHLRRMRDANRTTSGAALRDHFARRLGQMIRLVRRHGIDYSRLFTITAAR